jgi:hypothetical protein
MLSKLCLQSGCNLAGIGSLIPEKFDDHYWSFCSPNGPFTNFNGRNGKINFKKSTESIRIKFISLSEGSTLEGYLNLNAECQSPAGEACACTYRPDDIGFL